MSNLPTTDQPISMDPWLQERIEEMLEPHSGDDLEAARDAVKRVAESDFQGLAGEVLERYEKEIEEATS